jgi:hypothetical protein
MRLNGWFKSGKKHSLFGLDPSTFTQIIANSLVHLNGAASLLEFLKLFFEELTLVKAQTVVPSPLLYAHKCQWDDYLAHDKVLHLFPPNESVHLKLKGVHRGLSSLRSSYAS